jgi:predicted O-methyltransferase YrrM
MEKLKQTFAAEFKQFQIQKNTIRRLWNIDEQTAEFLYISVLLKCPQIILEIGTSNGYSAFWLSLAAEQNNAIVHTIESDQTRFELAGNNLHKRPNIIQYFGLAEEILPTLNFNFDYVFIDAGKINYLDYLKLILPKLNNLAIIIADNVTSHFETVKEYLDFVRNYPQLESVELKIGNGLEISVYHKQ